MLRCCDDEALSIGHIWKYWEGKKACTWEPGESIALIGMENGSVVNANSSHMWMRRETKEAWDVDSGLQIEHESYIQNQPSDFQDLCRYAF